jgi:hypothetical protein
MIECCGNISKDRRHWSRKAEKCGLQSEQGVIYGRREWWWLKIDNSAWRVWNSLCMFLDSSLLMWSVFFFPPHKSVSGHNSFPGNLLAALTSHLFLVSFQSIQKPSPHFPTVFFPTPSIIHHNSHWTVLFPTYEVCWCLYRWNFIALNWVCIAQKMFFALVPCHSLSPLPFFSI